MIVFKAYMKIIKSNIVLVSLYTVIFLIIAIVMASVTSSNGTQSFNEKKVKVQIINNDQDSILMQGLIYTISDKGEIIDEEEDKESIQDALFFRKVEYIVKIPDNFTTDFLAGKDVNIEKIQVNESFSAYYMDSLINKYLDTWKIYKENNTGLSDQEIKEKVIEDLNNQTKTVLYDNSKNTSVIESMGIFFNMTAYALLGSILLGIALCMTELNKDKIRQRNLCSPVKPSTISFNIILGNCILSFSIFLIMVIAAIIFYSDVIFTVSGMLIILNLFIITLCCMFIGMLVGATVKSRAAISAVSTTVSIGLCFISGVFVPQYFIGDSVKFIASFNPVYWFVKGNDEIIKLTNINFDSIKPILMSFSIELAFAICMLAIYLVITKEKAKRAES